MNVLKEVTASAGRVEAAKDVHGGRFSRTAGTHHGDEFALLDLEIDALERHELRLSLAIDSRDSGKPDQGVTRHQRLTWVSTITAMPGCRSPPVISVCRPSVAPAFTCMGTASPCCSTQTVCIPSTSDSGERGLSCRLEGRRGISMPMTLRSA